MNAASLSLSFLDSRVFWSLVVCLALAGLLYQVIHSIQKYSRHPVNTKYSIYDNPQSYLIFPYTTILSTFALLFFLSLSVSFLDSRVFWSLVVCLALAGLLYQVIHSIQKYSRHPVNTKYSIYDNPQSYLPFPAVTFCNINMFR